MRASLLALALAACANDQQTGLLVQLQLDANPDRLEVDVLDANHNPFAHGTYGATGGPTIPSSASFGVELADDRDGQTVYVRVGAYRGTLLEASADSPPATVALHRVTDVMLTLGGGDMSAPPDMLDPACTGATPLMPGVNQQGTTAAAANHDPLCSASGDQLYAVDVTEASLVTLKLDTTAWDGTMILRNGCDGTTVASGGPCTTGGLGADCPAPSGGQLTLKWCGLPAGRYYAVVDGHSSSASGAYTMQGTVAPLTNYQCANATQLLPPYPNSVSGITSGTSTMTAPTATNCGDRGATAPEAFFWVPFASGTRLRATIDSASGFTPLLYVISGCSATTAVCNDGTGQGGHLPAVEITPANSGPYIIVVDGQSGGQGTFQLTVDWQ